MGHFQERYDRYRAAVEEALQSLFLRSKPYGRLQEAMRYSLLAGGKRVRPVMTPLGAGAVRRHSGSREQFHVHRPVGVQFQIFAYRY